MYMEGIRVLIIDDEADHRLLASRAIKKSISNASIVYLEDGAKAIDYLFGADDGLDSGTALPGLMLLDLNMPKIDGREVLKRVRANERTRDIPVIVLTSSSEAKDIGYSSEWNAHYIHKPLDVVKLAEALKTLKI